MTDQILFDSYRPRPWHGLLPGRDPPRWLQANMEDDIILLPQRNE